MKSNEQFSINMVCTQRMIVQQVFDFDVYALGRQISYLICVIVFIKNSICLPANQSNLVQNMDTVKYDAKSVAVAFVIVTEYDSFVFRVSTSVEVNCSSNCNPVSTLKVTVLLKKSVPQIIVDGIK